MTDEDRRVSIARRLRREATFQERLFWNRFGAFGLEGFHPRRQAPIGPYIVDFACHATKIVVEIDGHQHGFDARAEKDRRRDAFLEAEGYRVFRFPNSDITAHLDDLAESVYQACLQRGARPRPDDAGKAPRKPRRLRRRE